MFAHDSLNIPLNNKHQYLIENRTFEVKVLLKLFEYSLGLHINKNIIYKKHLESFFLYPTYSTLIFFFPNYINIKIICFNLMKYVFAENQIQNHIVTIVSIILDNLIFTHNLSNKKNTILEKINIVTLEIINYIIMKSFYIHNNYKKYFLELLLNNNNFLDLFQFNKNTILLIVKSIIRLFIIFKKKTNVDIFLKKFFFKNISITEKNNKIFFFKGIILKKKSTIHKFRKFKYLNIKIMLLCFKHVFHTNNILQLDKNKIKHITNITKTLSHFFYKIKKNNPIILLTHFKQNNFIKYISKKIGVIIETNFNSNTIMFLKTYLNLPIFDFLTILQVEKLTKVITHLDIINEKYKKWIFLTNDTKNLFVTIIGSFSKYFLFDYFIMLLKSLISKIYNLLIDFRLCLNNGVLECGILQHINNMYLENKNHIYFFALISIIMKNYKYNNIFINSFLKNLLTAKHIIKNKKKILCEKKLITLNYDNYNWVPINEKKLIYKITKKIINEII
uniref:Uncharacterized protein n=1 Tax=Lotharella vacuolata TaxID=74820 RepID=A0A0H5BQX5_9EUKA|nr:hypothetical protein [Lotharella vacuolata]